MRDIIGSLNQQILSATGLTPKIGAELEFYVHPAERLEEFRAIAEKQLRAEGIPGGPVTVERGEGQCEIDVLPHGTPAQVAQWLVQARASLATVAEAMELTADFSARPLANQPGSGMHIHLTLHNAAGDNVLYKKDQNISPEMRHAIGGLIATLRESMLWFAPHEESYRRFVPKLNAPTHICWGGNNRTAALRLPDDISGYKHIEHRVPGADADPHAVVAAILAGAHHGLVNKIEPGEQIFGNAFLDMYALESLPKTLAEAKGAYEVGTVIRHCFM